MRVRRIAKRRAASAEHLGLRVDLAVDFETDGDEIGHESEKKSLLVFSVQEEEEENCSGGL
jgi:hypothetical protein